MLTAEKLRFEVTASGEVSALLLRPAEAKWMLALAHGAGAGMSHPFMSALAEELGRVGVATLRYQFPYMEARRRKPDAPNVAVAAVAAAVKAAEQAAAGLPLLAGGKSFGGRMTSTAAAELRLETVRGIVFFGFPLHPPNRPATKRGAHLSQVKQSMLFLQGTRDELADLELLRPICAKLGSRAQLHEIEDADHSFHVLKRSTRTAEGILRELAETTSAWAGRL
jgi:predicted alpha/beta-hydrolase family hydrolase